MFRDLLISQIFGFESFPTNGFEQMCINYANEKLQGQFNAVTFEAQRHEYAAEGVPWTAGAHSSNTRTLQALEGKLGILSLLHEQCRLPRGDDGKFVEAIRSAWKDHDAVRVPHLPVNAFCVAHYAGEVTYSCAGFVEKDRDALPEDVINLLSTSTSEFMRGLIVRAGCVHAGTGGCDRVGSSGSGASSSLGLQFKSQLNSLLGKVQQGASHYIRCVNPNATKHPGIFDWPTMLQQLRCSGLMDAVRVAREGHASRTPCADFVARYRCLAPTVATTSPAALLDAATEGPRLNSLDKQEEGEMRAAAHQLIDKLRTSAGLLEVLGCQEGAIAGRTKVFLQLGTLRALEAARTSVIAKACNLIQSSARRQAACLLLSRARDAVSMIQCVARGAIVRALARELRLRRAVTVIQSAARRHIARLSLARACAATRVLQRVARGATARALRRTLRREHACTVLLRGARHMLKQRRVAMAYTLAHAATVISAMWRSRIARACFKHAQRTALATQCTYQSACQRGTVDHADLASAPMDALPLAAGRLKVDAETIDEPQVASTHTAQGQFLQDKAVTIDSLTTQLQQLSLHALVQPAPESALSCDAGRGKENAPPHMAITTGDTHMRLEKVINRLLGQLRDERMQRVTQSAVLNSLEQLRESVAAKADSLSGLVHELQAPLYVSLDAAIERLSTVAADMYHATDTVDAAEAANAAARQNETIAEEQYARAAAHIEVLESRVAEQASLITALTRRAQRPREEATACKQVKSARDTTEETTAELEAWTAIPFAGITAFTKRVKRVASAASSLYIDHGDAASHTDESTGSLSNGFDFAYVRLLEKELALALQDPHMDIYENVPRAMLNRQHHSNDSPAHSACNLALSRMREQASVTALHEDIQFGRRKTIRLEKIVMMMTSELRELKLQRASMKRDAGDRALADLKQTRQELNIALADSRVALGILTDAVQKELKSARAHFSISGNSNG